MKIPKAILSICCLLMLSLHPATAAIMTATTTQISGTLWESRYTITNDSAAPINWFTIYFRFDLYQNFVYIPTPDFGPEWEIFTAEPLLSSDGFVDAFSYGDGIGVGQSVSNFVVRYHFLGEQQPQLQTFEVYDADSIEPLPVGSGTVDIRIVPQPASLWLFGVGFLALVSARKFVLSSRKT